MSNANVQYNGAQLLETVKRYLDDAVKVTTGMPLVYEVSPGNGVVTTVGNVVALPHATTTYRRFAGVVGPNSNNFTGPGWIDVIEPRQGDVFIGLCETGLTAGTDIVWLGETNDATATNAKFYAANDTSANVTVTTAGSYFEILVVASSGLNTLLRK